MHSVSFLVEVFTVVVACGPGVGRVQVSVCAEDGLALVGQVSDVCELMAVKLEHAAERLLFVPLAGQAVSNIVDILVKHVNLRFVVKSVCSVGVNFGVVGSNSLGVVLVVVLSLSDSLRKLKHFKSKGFDGNDLVGVNVDLLLIALLVCEGGAQVKIVHCVVVVVRHDGTVVAFGSSGFDSGLNGDISFNISAQVNGLGGDSESSKSKNEFHSCLSILIFIFLQLHHPNISVK